MRIKAQEKPSPPPLDNIVKYEYDGVGNIIKMVTGITNENCKSFKLTNSETVELDTAYTYNMQNRLASVTKAGETTNYTYDNMGNQTMKTITTIGEATGIPSVTIGEARNGIQMFEYDPLNRMTKATVNNTATIYTYDGNGLRQSKTTNGVTTKHIYDTIIS